MTDNIVGEFIEMKQIEKGAATANDFMKNVRDFTTHIIDTLKTDTEKASSASAAMPISGFSSALKKRSCHCSSISMVNGMLT